MDIYALRTKDRRTLHALFRSGKPVPADQLCGYLFDGLALGNPSWVDKIVWSRFQKRIDRDGSGVNIACHQDPPNTPWRALPKDPWGPFEVRNVTDLPEVWGSGAALDYRPHSSKWNPMGRMVDPLRDIGGLYLGLSLLQLGPTFAPTPSWFVLRRNPEAPHV